MPVINGIKYACEPCMRGHRSSKCTHKDRILVRVRKPGRPLSSCPHQVGSCTCGGIRVAIPKVSSCGCGPSDDHDETPSATEPAQPIPRLPEVRPSSSSSGSSARVQKVSKKKVQAPIAAGLSDAVLTDALQGGSQSVQYKQEYGHAASNSIEAQNGWNRIAPRPGYPQPHDPHMFVQQGRQQFIQTDLNRIPEFVDPTAKEFPQLQSPTDLRISNMSIHSGHNQAFPERAYGTVVPDARRPSWTAPDPPSHIQAVAQPAPSTIRKSCCRPEEPVPIKPQAPNHQPNAMLNLSPYAAHPLTGLHHGQPDLNQYQAFPPQHGYGIPPQPFSNQVYYPVESGISTFANPLTPAELAFLQSNAHLLQEKTEGQMGQHPVRYTTVDEALGHSCGCGDTCDCLGCASHPFNTRTMTFVRSVKNIMGSNPGAIANLRRTSISEPHDQPTSSCCGGAAQTSTASAPKLGDVGPVPQSPQSVSSTRSLNPRPVQPSPSSSDMDRQEGDNGQAISPSDFFHIDYPLGLCAENVDGCLCGDGCACLGCLTHGGHDGITLEHYETPTLETNPGMLAGPSTAAERPPANTQDSSFDCFQPPYNSHY